MIKLEQRNDHGTSRNDDAPFKRLSRPKTVSADLTPRSNDILQDYRKTPLVTGKKESRISIEDEALDESIPSGTKDTLANLRVQMDNLVGQLLQDAPIQMQPEWLAEPMKYRRYVLNSIPSADSTLSTLKIDAWAKQFSRLVALDVRAKRLGKIQPEESPFWREVLRRDIAKKRIDYETPILHSNAINTRAHELYDEWKALSPEGRNVLKRENDNVRAHQKFVLLRAQETCRMKEYASIEEAERDAKMLDKLGDNILVKDRFAQLVETLSERPAAAKVEVAFDDEGSTTLNITKRPPAPPRQGFFRRITAPFAAAAALMFGLHSAQDHDTPAAPARIAPTSEAVPVHPEVAIEAPVAEHTEAPASEKTHTIEKGDRLWDIARQEIADERGVTLKRVARDDREILPRVQALKILNDIDDATKLEIGTELRLEQPTTNVELRPAKPDPAPPETVKEKAPETSDVRLQTLESKASTYGNGIAVPPHEGSNRGNIDAPQIIKSRGDTAWAHADSMLENAGVKSTTLRRRLVAALMLNDSGNLNAYRLKIGQELTTTRANAAIEQLKAGKNPADIARSMGIEWPVRGL